MLLDLELEHCSSSSPDSAIVTGKGISCQSILSFFDINGTWDRWNAQFVSYLCNAFHSFTSPALKSRIHRLMLLFVDEVGDVTSSMSCRRPGMMHCETTGRVSLSVQAFSPASSSSSSIATFTFDAASH